jgi:N-acetylglucosamine-6-phosphate deacetylase
MGSSGGRRLGVAAAVVEGELVAGDVVVEGGRVREVGARPAGRAGIAAPGFVDVQVNGYAGVDFSATDPAGYATASRAMARTGVTAFLATIPTAAPDRYPSILATASDVASGDPLPGAHLAGVHLEGPFLSPQRAGAHRVEWLQPPDPVALAAWAAAAPVRLLTLAPELEGAAAVIAAARDAGIVVAVGHTDAEASVAQAAFDEGASAITHLWNAHRPIASRDPGPGGVALARPDVFVCAIADLVHVAPETLAFTVAAAGERFVAVTDAVAWAGLDDGPYRMGDRTVLVADGAVRLDDGTLAGSATALDQGVRNLVGLGIDLPRALDAVTRRPARLLGDDTLGRLAPEGPATLTVLDDDLRVVQVLVGGAEV